MSVLSGLGTILGARFERQNQGLFTIANMVKTGVSTGLNTVGALATGDIGGAASALVDGAKEQAGNVIGHVTSPLRTTVKEWQGVGEMIGGVGELLGGSPEKAEPRE